MNKNNKPHYSTITDVINIQILQLNLKGTFLIYTWTEFEALDRKEKIFYHHEGFFFLKKVQEMHTEVRDCQKLCRSQYPKVESLI